MIGKLVLKKTMLNGSSTFSKLFTEQNKVLSNVVHSENRFINVLKKLINKNKISG